VKKPEDGGETDAAGAGRGRAMAVRTGLRSEQGDECC